MLVEYRKHIEERAALGIPPLPLSVEQTTALVELLKNPPAGEHDTLVDLLVNRVPAGVDDAARVKAGFLSEVAKGDLACSLVSRVKATELLGTMLGGFNIESMITLIDDAEVGEAAAEGLKKTLLVFDYFFDIIHCNFKGKWNVDVVY